MKRQALEKNKNKIKKTHLHLLENQEKAIPEKLYTLIQTKTQNEILPL